MNFIKRLIYGKYIDKIEELYTQNLSLSTACKDLRHVIKDLSHVIKECHISNSVVFYNIGKVSDINVTFPDNNKAPNFIFINVSCVENVTFFHQNDSCDDENILISYNL